MKIERDIADTDRVIVHGVRTVRSKPFTRKFRNLAAVDRWSNSEAGEDYEIIQIERAP